MRIQWGRCAHFDPVRKGVEVPSRFLHPVRLASESEAPAHIEIVVRIE